MIKMNEETSELRKGLGIDDWLELVKEDKNLKGAYICFGQYMDILEKREKQLQNNWNELNKFIDENIKSLEEEMTNKKCDNAVAIYGREMNGFFKVRRKMQELEQGKDE